MLFASTNSYQLANAYEYTRSNARHRRNSNQERDLPWEALSPRPPDSLRCSSAVLNWLPDARTSLGWWVPIQRFQKFGLLGGAQQFSNEAVEDTRKTSRLATQLCSFLRQEGAILRSASEFRANDHE